MTERHPTAPWRVTTRITGAGNCSIFDRAGNVDIVVEIVVDIVG